MKKIALKVRSLILFYLKWGWPMLLADIALGDFKAPWRALFNVGAFVWVLCVPVAPLSLLLDRTRRERAMALLCGLREGDERERIITGEAARATLLLALFLQVVLLVMTMITVRLVWDPTLPKGTEHGLVACGLSFSTERHLNPFGVPAEPPAEKTFGTSLENPSRNAMEVTGYLLSPSAFPVLALMILIQLAAFKAFAMRRYEGSDA